MHTEEHATPPMHDATLNTWNALVGHCELSGQWDQNTSWKFELAEHPPLKTDCASVGAIVLSSAGLSLTRTPRGYWELPGGHIEPLETIEQSLHREVLEEVGLLVRTSTFFGVTIVKAEHPIINRANGLSYPNPGYIPHYLCWGEDAPGILGEEIIEIRHVSLQALSTLDSLDIPERGILHMGLARSLSLSILSDSDRDSITSYLNDRGLDVAAFKTIWGHD